jgi:hypothetical protein
MNVDFQGRGLPIPAALADHARRRLHFVLMQRGELVQRVVVRLGCANNRRGHSDMYCLMQVHMSDALAAAVVDIGPDIHEVIDRASDRVGRMVAEHLEQTRGNWPPVEASAKNTATSGDPRKVPRCTIVGP